MSLNNTMTLLADAVRSKSGTSDKLTIAAMTEAVNNIIINPDNNSGNSSVEYGYIDENGLFQTLDLSGENPDFAGEASAVTSAGIFVTGQSEPAYAAGGGAFDLAKVTEYTPYSAEMTAITSVEVSGMGTIAEEDRTAANGTYTVTAETADKTDWKSRVYKHSTAEYYLYYYYDPDYPEESYWQIGASLASNFLVRYSTENITSGNATWENWDYGDSCEITTTTTETTTPEQPMVLKGVSAVSYENEVWTFSDTEITFTGFEKEPKKNGIYAVNETRLIGSHIAMYYEPGTYLVPNDEDTVVLFYPPASKGKITNLAAGASRLNAEPVVKDISVENDKMVFGVNDYLITFPANSLPSGVFGTGEFTLDIWYSTDWDSYSSSIMGLFGSASGSRYDWITSSDGKVWIGGRDYNPLVAAGNPVPPRRLTFEVWDNGGTLTWTTYLNGVKNLEGTYTDTTKRQMALYIGWVENTRFLQGTIAHFSIRAVADHKGQSFEVTENPYA